MKKTNQTPIIYADAAEIAADPSIVEDVKEGRARLVFSTSRGKLQEIAYSRGTWWMFRGGRWADLTDEAAKAVAPEIHAKRMEKRAERRKEAEERAKEQAATVKVGDVMVASWGYEQTNIDYFEVVAKESTLLTIRKIAQTYEYDGWASGVTEPVPGAFERYTLWADESNEAGKRCKIDKYGYVKVTKDGVVSAKKWDGKPRRFSEYA